MAKQDLTAELFYSGVWNTVAAYTRDPAIINRERAVGAEPTPVSTSLTLQGIYNPKNPMSPLYGLAGQNTPIRIKLGTDVRFYGEVASWSPGRAIKGDSWTFIQVNGILRRLGQGADPLRSAMYRSMIGTNVGDYVPHAYWPLEDGKDSTQFANAVPGQPGQAQIFVGSDPVRVADDDSMPGSAPVPTIPGSSYIEFPIPAYTDTGQIVHQAAFHLTDASAVGGLIIYAEELIIQAQFDSNTLDIAAAPITTGVPIFTNSDTVTADQVVDQWVSLIVSSVDTGPGDTLISRLLDDQGNTIAQTIDVNPGVYRRHDRGLVASGGPSDLGAGHYAVFVDANFTAATDGVEGARAMSGWAGEQAHERVERLCLEEGITVTIDGSESQPMGPQPRETLVNLFAEIERTDDGILWEPRDSYGLKYRTGRERYNRTAVLALDYAAKQIAPPFAPVLDDLVSRNHVTVARRNGSSAIATLETGALSVLAPPNGIGRYRTQVDVNTETDDVLTNHAGWHLHKGTVDEVRYATVTVDLDAAPALATTAAAVDIGDLITIDNLPDDETLVQARLHVTGYAERIESHRRLITFTCIPASTYDVGVYGTDAIVSRYDSAHSTLSTSYSATATSLVVNTAAGHTPWVTGSSGPTFPFDIGVSGVRIRVTAISSATSPQTFTVTRSMDGYDKALASGASVRLWRPARYAL